ncbi:MAG: tetratricopeptide repeat protein [Acidobacteriota bacterium]
MHNLSNNEIRKTKIQLIVVVIFLLFLSTILLSQITNVPYGSKEYYKQLGDFYLDKLEYEDAINCYKKLHNKSKDKGIRRDIGYAYLQLGEYAEAEKFLKEEILLFPEDYDSLLLLGCLYFRQGKKKEALEIFMDHLAKDKTLKKSKVSLKGLSHLGLAEYALGLYYKNEGDCNKAVKYFLNSLNRGFDPVKNIVQRADTFILRNDLSSALKEIDLGINDYGNHNEFYFMKGYILYKMGKIEESLENFVLTVRLEPGFKEARINIGTIYYNLGNYEEAFKRYKTLKIRFPDDSLIKDYYAYALLKMGKPSLSDAESIFTAVRYQTQIVPDKIPLTKEFIEKSIPEFKYGLRNSKRYILNALTADGLNLIRNGLIKEGLSKFHTALQIDPKSPEVNYNVGLIYLNLEDYEDAYLYAQRAVDTKKFYLEGYDLLGNAYFRLEEFDKSIQAFKKTVQLNSDDAQAYYNLGCAFFAAKLYREAEDAWLTAIQVDERREEKGEDIMDKTSGEKSEVYVKVLKRTISFHSYKSLGYLYAETRELEKAIKNYNKALGIFPTDADCYYELGKLYLKIGDKQNAIKYLKKYLEYGTEKEKEVKELLKKLFR